MMCFILLIVSNRPASAFRPLKTENQRATARSGKVFNPTSKGPVTYPLVPLPALTSAVAEVIAVVDSARLSIREEMAPMFLATLKLFPSCGSAINISQV
ncbi:hypothetical protein DITRI_Ditri11bG0081800 [Diplodiscus trichospermus]